MFIVYLLAAICYATISIHLYWALVRKKSIAKTFTLSLLSIGAMAHASILYPHIVTSYGLNFNLFNTVSLISLFFIIFYGLFCLYRPILSLGVLAAPTALIGVSVGYFGIAPYHPLVGISRGLEAHILLSFAAYCVLLMAAVQAVIMRFQIRELKRKTAHRFWVNKLPPLQSMEGLLFDMILVGFVLLSLALGLGFVYVKDIIGQHIAHKMVFSIISWLIFGGMIIGHWRAGWRGRRAADLTIFAFVLLALGFVGSKFVLEFLL
ncbi:cytochrome C assembly family protein [Psychrobacter sp. I-STPA10]|uniref:cytochrome C assembly family protein n=1 Tax=Psychrobacter sp. I-STPA10 TaxID=2585769 RepID=UPI001E31654D|nr:cytochrome c biogenesis protein CcsA [Psychrobacter sp. I-STPA10]